MRALTAAVILAVAAGCGAPSSGAPQDLASSSAPSPHAPARRGPFVVAIVVDQLPAWLAVERWPTLPPTGGFARLLAESSDSAVLRYRHAHNATALGHSSLFTGAVPHDSGIVANGKLMPDGGYRTALLDQATRVVSAAGETTRESSSAETLLVPTVADVLRDRHPDARVISVSMKDRGAIFGAGKRPDVALWFDPTVDGFVTSTAYARTTPAWAVAFTAAGAAARYRTEPWKPLDPDWLGKHAERSLSLGQGDFHHLGREFPHEPAKASPAARAFVATPSADAMLIDLAKAAIDQTAASNTPTLLAVSLSATDYVGHVFGPDAPEAWDHMLRLDAMLADLLAHLDRTLGPDGYGVVLSSDHGVPPTPEVMSRRYCRAPGADAFERRCEAAVRLTEAGLAKVVEDSADRTVGAGNWVRGGNEPYVELTPEARALSAADRAKLMSAAIRALEALPGVRRAISVEAAPDTCPALDDESEDALVCRSIRKGRGGDIFIVLDQGSFIDTGYVEGFGVNHGSHWLYDRTVPIVVRPPRRPGAAERSRTFDASRSVDHRAYAATLAAMLGIEPPAAARGGAVFGRGSTGTPVNSTPKATEATTSPSR